MPATEGGEIEAVLITEDPHAVGQSKNDNNNNVSLLSLEEAPAAPPPATKADSATDSPVEAAAAAAATTAAAAPAVKQKSNGKGGAAVELPPIKKGDTFYDAEVVNDQRFANLFESLTGNFFTDAFGRHPLIA